MSNGWKNSINKNKHPYVFIAPAVIILTVFSIVPIIVAFLISFTDLDLKGLADWSNVSFIGMDNYSNLLSDELFHKSIFNTLFYVIIGVPLVIIFSLGIALLLNYGTSKLFTVFRGVYYMPSITNIIAVAVIWGFLYNTEYGLFNYILSLLDVEKIPWLGEPTIAKLSLIVLAVWKGVGINMIIFLAALQGIPKSYYEAAEMDGANRWQVLWNVTIPLLRYATFFVTVTTLIGWLQFFEEPFVMTNGGPLDGTISMALFIYQKGFQFSEFGYAAAGSFILFIVIIIITLLQFKLRKSDTEF
ncbi:carbohydrate ABC transporter membrane protein 1 (CUT1 family) [Bacillus sp. V-88]|jgi:multiple sugar transport system permease protein|uniref:carbohydrate ABC transporter permease n=1 Tax=Rossellomorea vietnamensis TaxID=218284 RepID=UPI000551F143|nr:sugar ABC transporter permease [Rossellomorea vietnamensis]MCC5802188.1 sugar ABC transporter permease [Rossellomorea vietnamensis]OXS58543.1 sugar ABC transporter permease [Bacillus sp. DSM 27956]PRX75447.1 carbohydrate ABC transporter membrane protein 1 (CUT1 family) [Bacillus sp. V-88]SLK23666.1 carbohydrate ABC transporter membrane protein 1, CUT1 family [Bacillus sp. V-88]